MEIIKKIGNGTFGVVYEVVVDGERRAAKTSVFGDDDDSIKKEIAQLNRANHINIVTVFGLQLHENVSYLIMEYMEGGTMRDLRETKDFKLTDVINWFCQVAAGLAYLHAMTPQPMLHRDIKPHNILLSKDLKLAKIGDFGTSRDLASTMTNYIGTALYMAPEVFESRKYPEKCDVYSFGISLWEMLTRKRPFAEYDNAWQIQLAAHMGKRPSFEGLGCHRILIDLMSFCWHKDPTKRPVMQIVFKVLRNALKLYKHFKMSMDLLAGNAVGHLDKQMVLSAQQKVTDFLLHIHKGNTNLDTDSSEVLDISLLQWEVNRPLIDIVDDSKDKDQIVKKTVHMDRDTFEALNLISLLKWAKRRHLIGIVDDSKCNSKISKDQWTSVEAAVDDMALQLIHEYPGTTISYTNFGWLRNSIMLMLCKNKKLLKLLKIAIANIGQVYPGAQLRVVRAKDLPFGT